RAPIVRAFLVPIAPEYRDLVEEFSAVHSVLNEVQVGPYPQKHAIEVRIRRRFFDGDRPAVSDELRADGIAIVVDDLASRGPQSVDTHQRLAFIDRPIGAFD